MPYLEGGPATLHYNIYSMNIIYVYICIYNWQSINNYSFDFLFFLFIDFSCFVSHWTWKNRSKVWIKIKSLAKDVFRTVEFFYGMSIHWQSHLLKGTNQRWFNLESGSFLMFFLMLFVPKVFWTTEQLQQHHRIPQLEPFFRWFLALFVL